MSDREFTNPFPDYDGSSIVFDFATNKVVWIIYIQRLLMYYVLFTLTILLLLVLFKESKNSFQGFVTI